MTFKDLKEKLSNLSEEQLNQEIILTGGEDHTHRIAELWILEEDYVNMTDEGMEPVSAYLEEETKDEPIVAHKGDVFLLEG
jgi:hypothetical protein